MTEGDLTQWGREAAVIDRWAKSGHFTLNVSAWTPWPPKIRSACTVVICLFHLVEKKEKKKLEIINQSISQTLFFIALFTQLKCNTNAVWKSCWPLFVLSFNVNNVSGANMLFSDQRQSNSRNGSKPTCKNKPKEKQTHCSVILPERVISPQVVSRSTLFPLLCALSALCLSLEWFPCVAARNQ